MYRYPLGRGRWLATASAVVILVGCVLPWYTAGGQVGNLPPITGNAFESSGIPVFQGSLTSPLACRRSSQLREGAVYAVATDSPSLRPPRRSRRRPISR